MYLTYIGRTFHMAIPREEFMTLYLSYSLSIKILIIMINKIKTKQLLTLNKDDLIYLAGFLDGDGSILAQIVFDKTRKYDFRIRVTINFHQHKRRAWFLIWIGKLLKIGKLNKRKTSNWEYTIYGRNEIKDLLIILLPYLKIKRPIAKIILEIINLMEKMETRAELLEVMKLVDKTAFHTDSKLRKWTSLAVIEYWNSGKLPTKKVNVPSIYNKGINSL